MLLIDGDSFAHRAYHGVPKNIRTADDKPANAILGFANMLLRLYRTENPRAVLVGWDTLESPTYRHTALPGYQGGREFDDDLVEQLALIPKFVAACGFANAKRAGYEADDFLAAAASAEPSANVNEITTSILMPTSEAAVGLNETARIALPILVFITSNCRPISSTMPVINCMKPGIHTAHMPIVLLTSVVSLGRPNNAWPPHTK